MYIVMNFILIGCLLPIVRYISYWIALDCGPSTNFIFDVFRATLERKASMQFDPGKIILQKLNIELAR